jgi:Dockerin type I domain
MDTLPRLAAWLDDAYKVRGDLKYILDHAPQFFVSSSDVSVLWNKNEDLIQSLLSTAESCRTTPQTACKLPPPPDFGDIQAVRNRACDLNHDGKIDGVDVNLLIANVLGNDGVRADLNNDGQVNIVDVQILVNTAVSGQCRLRN